MSAPGRSMRRQATAVPIRGRGAGDAGELPATSGGNAFGRPRRLGTVPALDGVRGVAVLLVVAYHFRYMLDPWTTRWARLPAVAGSNVGSGRWVLLPHPHPAPILGHLIPRGGFLGVDIFFVLSGFLITALLLREHTASGRIGFRGFYQRRALRLLPALFLFVIAQFIYASIVHVPSNVEQDSITSVLFYYWNWQFVYGYPAIPPALAHLWSLSVEEQFYLVWPLVIVVCLSVRRRFVTMLTVMGTAVLAIAIWREVLAHHERVFLLYYRTDTRADSLIIGAIAAILWARGFVPPRRVLVPAACAALLFVAFCVVSFDSTDRFLYDGGFTAIAIAVAVILISVMEADWLLSRVLTIRALRAVGRVAYGLYLWHVLVFWIVSQHMRSSPAALRITTAFALTAAVTVFSWTVVERPFLRLKDRNRNRNPRDRVAVRPR